MDPIKIRKHFDTLIEKAYSSFDIDNDDLQESYFDKCEFTDNMSNYSYQEVQLESSMTQDKLMQATKSDKL